MGFCRETGEEDVNVKVLYCGICHSDLHNIKDERGTAKYPMVPGYVSFPTPLYPYMCVHTQRKYIHMTATQKK